MIRPFAPFTPRPRVATAVKVAYGPAPSNAEPTLDTVDGKTFRSMVRLASSKDTPTLKVLGRKPQTIVLGKRG